MVSGRGAAFGAEAYVTEQDRFFGFAGAWELGTRVARARDAHGARSWHRAIALVTASRNARVRIVATLPRSRRGPAMVRAWIAASICLAVARVSGSTGASCRARSAVRRAPWALNDALHGPAFASAPGGMRAGSGVAVTSAVVFNNNALGWELHRGGPFAAEFNEFDHTAIARAIGCQRERIADPAALGPALGEAVVSRVPTVLDVRTSLKVSFADITSPLVVEASPHRR